MVRASDAAGPALPGSSRLDHSTVTLDEAVALIGPAVHERGGRWADLGAGTGTFTEALLHLLGPEGHVIAVERDRQALSELRGLAGRSGSELGAITVVESDLLEL